MFIFIWYNLVTGLIVPPILLQVVKNSEKELRKKAVFKNTHVCREYCSSFTHSLCKA